MAKFLGFLLKEMPKSVSGRTHLLGIPINYSQGNRSRVEQHEIKGFLQSRGPF
jgi:hypothetical protein